MTRTINLNADVGEGQDDDAELLRLVASGSIACGGHAGDASSMLRTLSAAKAAGAGVGAHPSFDDREGFGRREMALSLPAIVALVERQISLLVSIAASSGTRLEHVKPHGALYNMAARDAGIASAIGSAIGAVDRGLVYVGLSGSEMEHAAARLGLHFAREAFPDRGYGDDGRLLPRGTPGAVFSDPLEIAERAVRMAQDGEICTSAGRRIAIAADTLCIHGDVPGAVAIAGAVRHALAAAGIGIVPLARRG